MTRHLRRRFYVEATLGMFAFIGGVMTLINHAWIEALFGIDPDQGTGVVEWGIVGILVIAAGVLGSLAGYEWRRFRTVSVP